MGVFLAVLTLFYKILAVFVVFLLDVLILFEGFVLVFFLMCFVCFSQKYQNKILPATISLRRICLDLI